MAIDTTLVLVVFALSAIPYLILGVAEIMTGSYKRRILQKRISRFSELPYLVRLHGMLVRRASINLLVNVAMVLSFFGIPILFVGIVWPDDLVLFLTQLQFWIFFWCVIILFRVACNSPDPTGGLEEAYELLDTNNHEAGS